MCKAGFPSHDSFLHSLPASSRKKVLVLEIQFQQPPSTQWTENCVWRQREGEDFHPCKPLHRSGRFPPVGWHQHIVPGIRTCSVTPTRAWILHIPTVHLKSNLIACSLAGLEHLACLQELYAGAPQDVLLYCSLK
jgi:hypothetical protein